jgi:hypothetical protein
MCHSPAWQELRNTSGFFVYFYSLENNNEVFSSRQPRPAIIKSDVSETDFVSIITTPLMETEPLSETSDFINRLTRLSAGENVTDFFRRESFKTCNMEVVELFSLALNLMAITSEPPLRDVRNLAQG